MLDENRIAIRQRVSATGRHDDAKRMFDEQFSENEVTYF
jgi:hypothetical protein